MARNKRPAQFSRDEDTESKRVRLGAYTKPLDEYSTNKKTLEERKRIASLLAKNIEEYKARKAKNAV
jgi:hypothetical protein